MFLPLSKRLNLSFCVCCVNRGRRRQAVDCSALTALCAFDTHILDTPIAVFPLQPPPTVVSSNTLAQAYPLQPSQTKPRQVLEQSTNPTNNQHKILTT